MLSKFLINITKIHLMITQNYIRYKNKNKINIPTDVQRDYWKVININIHEECRPKVKHNFSKFY